MQSDFVASQSVLYPLSRWPESGSSRHADGSAPCRPLSVLSTIHPLARGDRQRQTVLRRRQRASREVGEHAGRIFGFIEIELHGPFLLKAILGQVHIQETR